MSDHHDRRPNWWDKRLTRRHTTSTLGLAALASAAGVKLTACKAQPPVEEHDALKLQKTHGFDVGDAGKALSLERVVDVDSTGSEQWQGYVDADRLLAATRAPKAWTSTEDPTLIQSLGQAGVQDAIKPINTTGMKQAYLRGRALAALITAVEDPAATMLVVDLDGPASVALAAAMADLVAPVFRFENWPHPLGVVASHEVLAAMVFHARELETKAKERTADSPVAVVLDRRRLSPSQPPRDKFDNRYFVDLPQPAELAERGIKRVLYVAPTDGGKELDDLNDPLANIAAAKIPVRRIGLDAFARDPNAPEHKSTGGYYYGGSHRHHTHFFVWYPMFLYAPGRYRWTSGTAPPRNRVRPPTWRPTRRPTVFSSRTRGAGKGVGRVKPAGFGRVSARVGNDGRVVRVRNRQRSRSSRSRTRTRTRRTTGRRGGSWGRSRGGFGG